MKFISWFLWGGEEPHATDIACVAGVLLISALGIIIGIGGYL